MTGARTTWVPGAAGSGHDVDHLPYAAALRPAGTGGTGGDGSSYLVCRIGDHALDLGVAARLTAPDLVDVLDRPDLGALLAGGRPVWTAVRAWLTDLLTEPDAEPLLAPLLTPVAQLDVVLPFRVADYVDFYCSAHHAGNVGRIFRPDDEPLLPNWRHLPVGYHGRAGTVVVSGTPVARPTGQYVDAAGTPVFGPTRRLDLEAEVAYVVGPGTAPGTRLAPTDLADHVLGVVLLDDWSARDVQAWEYRPLGPFLGKSFATSISAWVTPLDALGAAWTDLPGQDPEPLPHLRVDGPAGLAIDLEVEVAGTVVSRPPYATTYWGPGQMLAHLTSGGAPLRSGDLFASGTVSGPARDQRGCLLELTWGWREPVATARGERLGLEDGDEVVVRGSAPSLSGGRLELGEVRGTVVPPAG